VLDTGKNEGNAAERRFSTACYGFRKLTFPAQPHPVGVIDEKGFSKDASMEPPEGLLVPSEAFLFSK